MFTRGGGDDMNRITGVVIVQRRNFKHQLTFCQHGSCRRHQPWIVVAAPSSMPRSASNTTAAAVSPRFTRPWM